MVTNLASSQQSHLSDYGYDMVTAVTQQAVNAVMKQFMAECPQKEYTLVLKRVFNEQTEKYTYEPFDYDKIKDKLDLFSIPDNPQKRTPQQKAAYKEAYNTYKISYAFKAQLGINYESISKVPNIVQLEEGDISSKFNAVFAMLFKEMTVIQLKGEDERVIMNKISQSKDSPWIFSFYIKLNYLKKNYSECDMDVQAQVRETLSNPDIKNFDNLFDIRALYADFTTAAVKEYPTISADPEFTEILQRAFIEMVLGDFKTRSTEAIFSYSVKPENKTHLKNALIIPTSYKYYVSPYYENGKPAPDKKDLYTINYVAMSDMKDFPELRAINWNWVDMDERNDKHGCMAVNRNIVFNKLIRELLDITSKTYIVPKVTLEREGLKIIVTTSYSHSGKATESDFTYDSKEKTYTMHYKKTDKDHVYCIFYFSMEVSYMVDIKLSVPNEKQIDIEIFLHGYLNMQHASTHSTGTMTQDTIKTSLFFTADEEGQIGFSLSPVEVFHKDSDIDISIWGQILTTGTVERCVKSLTKFTDTFRDEIKQSIETRLPKMLNDKTHWVLPGRNVFKFKDPGFSSGLDMVTDLTYKKPE